jgi:streptogramin lyase
VIDTQTSADSAVPLTGFPGVQLRSIARDDDGTLWLGSQLRGVLHFDPGSGRVRAYMAAGIRPSLPPCMR